MAKKKNSKEITDEVNKEEIPAAEEAVDPQEAGTAEGTEEVPETEVKPVDNPKAVGYIHFYRGSYHGVLLSGMDGDYFLENGKLRQE